VVTNRQARPKHVRAGPF